jgi:hypothetical protein
VKWNSSHLVDVVLLFLAEAEDVKGLVGKLHVLLVVDGVHGHLIKKNSTDLLLIANYLFLYVN